MIAATAMCAAAATEVAAQTSGQDATIIRNNQLQSVDVTSDLVLNVEGATDQITGSNSAYGNRLSGAVQNGTLQLGSRQTMRGDSLATTTIAGRETEGAVNVVTQAGGNYLAAGAYGASASVEATQTVEAGEITAGSSLTGGTARLLEGGSIGTSAIANRTDLGGTGAVVIGTVTQSSDASVRASNLVETQYIPASADVSAQATGNAVAANSTGASSQNLGVRQTSTGTVVTADASANAGNAWDLAGRANAAANQAVLTNQGGAMISRFDQTNGSAVSATARVTAYDFGAAVVSASGAGNLASAGNNDRYLKLDNTQLNTGGVEVQATMIGTNGYDAYVGADAVGNSVTGYACSECSGTLTATNVQNNSGNVSATANTSVVGANRAVITGVNAVGNSATFYVSRPGSGN